MINEVTSRTKICTDCGVVGHFTVMDTHVCDSAVIDKPKTKTTKKK